VATAVAVLALLALLAAGCSNDGGGSDDDGEEAAASTTAPPTTAASPESYAMAVCTAVGGWQGEIGGLVSGLQSSPPDDPAAGKQVLTEFVAQVSSSTDEMVTAVRDAGPPDVEEGAEIHDTLVGGLSDLAAAFVRVGEDVAALPEDDPEAFVAAVGDVTADIGTSAQLVGDAFAAVETEHPAGFEELQAAFVAEPSCAPLVGS
jgi:hypothetical protein